ncbi:MAG: cation-translocating P-type ATPase [Gammaproteobacteria bacterium]|nr:cation-translocating P-type ATPase [Gammaproteobacteria bacterium]
MTASEHQQLLTTGLTDADAQRRLTEYGANELAGASQRHLWRITVDVIREPMFLLLVAGGIIYLVLGDVREALILLASVVVVMGITIYQERKTERTLHALRDLSSPRALVIRDGEQRRIPGREVVPGDLVILGEGDRVPADGVLLECNQFSVDESLLTGESLPVAKHTDTIQATQMEAAGSEATAFVYSGSLVVQGQGIARLLATGSSTQIGHIGKALQQLDIENTPLQRQTARVIRVFAAVGLSACVLVVLLYALLRGGWLDGLLAGITLAMAVLPEEFPVVLTVFLALGAWRISQKRVLTRRIPAIETLGSATVLCVDKTGTLTENRMVLSEIAFPPSRENSDEGKIFDGTAKPIPTLRPIVQSAALACELNPSDPMERAILRYAHDANPDVDAMRAQWRLVREYDLTPELLAVTHCWKIPERDELLVASKGAPETIARLCQLDDNLRHQVLDQTKALAAQGRRVLAVAEARFQGNNFPNDPTGFTFNYLGLLALADPVRATVPHAIHQCHDAGIRVVMITGDHPGTAEAIARQIGLESTGGVITGKQLALLSTDELRARVQQVSIFARVIPQQKLLLVNALKANGEIVAMTGDGVNDAPALKAAHIGVAMGHRGTDVAREAAALILLDDEFPAIVDTIKLGRRIYDNIRHAMAYLVAVHIPTAGMALVPLLTGLPLLFFPVHIVFLEFIIDPACSIAFEAEPAHPDTMKRRPRDPHEPLLGTQLLGYALFQGLAVLFVISALYWFTLGHGTPEPQARATAFAALVLGNIGLILANRSQTRRLWATLSMPNPALWFVVAGALGGLLLVLYVPSLRDVFHFEALGWQHWLLSMVAGSAGMIGSEVFKRMRQRWSAPEHDG